MVISRGKPKNSGNFLQCQFFHQEWVSLEVTRDRTQVFEMRSQLLAAWLWRCAVHKLNNMKRSPFEKPVAAQVASHALRFVWIFVTWRDQRPGLCRWSFTSLYVIWRNVISINKQMLEIHEHVAKHWFSGKQIKCHTDCVLCLAVDLKALLFARWELLYLQLYRMLPRLRHGTEFMSRTGHEWVHC